MWRPTMVQVSASTNNFGHRHRHINLALTAGNVQEPTASAVRQNVRVVKPPTFAASEPHRALSAVGVPMFRLPRARSIDTPRDALLDPCATTATRPLENTKGAPDSQKR